MRQSMRLLIAVLIPLVAGCATAPAPEPAAPSVDVSGNWAGTWAFENAEAGTGNVMLELHQMGADVAGNATVTTRVGTRNTFFTGTVAGNTLTLKPPYAVGSLTVNGDEMTGMVEGIMPASVVLRRQR